MHQIEIRRPTEGDVNKLALFFKKVIEDTFSKEGLSQLVDDMENEIKDKNKYLRLDLTSNGKDRYFLLAVLDNGIIGTIEFGPASDLIVSCTAGAYKGLMEVGTVFVHPDYQRQGIGNLLIKEMLHTLQNKGFNEFCLDSGYSRAQKIWKKKFGEPDYFLKDYWGTNNHHMVWKINIQETLKV
ncbi:GNAT family N-acetyltransferase [Bacillus marasmi]|uniref:GNAT family N-acetyltransferase n=1 Tax=Bacillus marasmi TaxID=1926279 RepID=UPI0011CB105C|nr:GNAT family N-acetyltransferase [Bacillus marasmi]